MDLTWWESILYGLISGLAEILPVSARAHQLLLLKIFGVDAVSPIMPLMIHISVMAALYICCQTHIVRILRAKKLARIPKKKRKRPLDPIGLMDYSLWKTMLIPTVIAFFFYQKTSKLENNIFWVVGFLFLNGIILYIPQYLPGSNKDSRSLSRVEGLIMGLGGAATVLPGISCIGASASIGRIVGVEHTYGLSMAFLLELAVLAAQIVMDILGIASVGLDGFSFSLLLSCVLASITAFGATVLAVNVIKKIISEMELTVFSYYCWGIALFTFMLMLFV